MIETTRVAVCDGCAARAPLPGGRKIPDGWRGVWVSKPHPDVSRHSRFIVCGPMCAARCVDMTYDDETTLRVVR